MRSKRTGIKSIREQTVIDLLRLKDSGDSIIGVDAIDENNNEYEIKTSTRDKFAIARDVHLSHTEKWKKLNWIFVIGDTPDIVSFDIKEVYYFPKTNKKLIKLIEKYENEILSENSTFLKIISILNTNLNNPLFTSKDLTNIRKLKSGVLKIPKINIPFGFVKDHGIKLEYPYHESLLKWTTKENKNQILEQDRQLILL